MLLSIIVLVVVLTVNYHVGQYFINRTLSSRMLDPDLKISKRSKLIKKMASFNNRIKLLIEPIHLFLGSIVDMVASLVDFVVRLFDIILLTVLWPYVIYTFKKGLNKHLETKVERSKQKEM